MKHVILALMLFSPAALLGQSTNDFPLTVHVISSEIAPVPDNASDTVKGVELMDLLHATIDGHKYVLAEPVHGRFFAGTHPVVLEPGNYPARIVQERRPNPGEIQRTYRMRLANGKTALLLLWGISE